MSPRRATRPSSRRVLVVAALAVAGVVAPGVAGNVAPSVARAADPALPPAAASALDAFRKVAWTDHLKPSRPDPAPSAWRVRCAAEWALAALEGTDAAALLPLLADADRFVRALVARSVGIAQPAGASKALLAALAAEKDKVVRVALVEALGRVGGDGALEAVEAQQTAGADQDVAFAVGIARRQLKGGAWDVASLRGEHAEAARAGRVDVAKLGEPAPELALPSPSGPVHLATLKGRIVVLVFAHGDRGAGQDMKALQRLTMEEERLRAMNAAVVVVEPHEKERTKAWADRVKLPFTIASDPAGRGAAAYGVARQLHLGGEWLPSPAWCVIDREGRLVWRKVGTKPDEQASLGDLVPVLDQVARGIKVY